MIALILAIAFSALWGLIELNVWDYQRRAKMSPEERQKEDDEMRIE